eukprot:7088420-Karenia_brevis.AAC.1
MAMKRAATAELEECGDAQRPKIVESAAEAEPPSSPMEPIMTDPSNVPDTPVDSGATLADSSMPSLEQSQPVAVSRPRLSDQLKQRFNLQHADETNFEESLTHTYSTMQMSCPGVTPTHC